MLFLHHIYTGPLCLIISHHVLTTSPHSLPSFFLAWGRKLREKKVFLVTKNGLLSCNKGSFARINHSSYIDRTTRRFILPLSTNADWLRMNHTSKQPGFKPQTRKECRLNQGKGNRDTVRVSAQSGQRGEKRETWVSRHYDLRTELGGGRPKNGSVGRKRSLHFHFRHIVHLVLWFVVLGWVTATVFLYFLYSACCN